MNAEFINALNELEEEKGISKEVLLDAIKTALVAAYKRDVAERARRHRRDDGRAQGLCRKDSRRRCV